MPDVHLQESSNRGQRCISAVRIHEAMVVATNAQVSHRFAGGLERVVHHLALPIRYDKIVRAVDQQDRRLEVGGEAIG